MIPQLIKPKREVTKVFLHCSASGHAHHNDVSVMRQWHLARGWDDVGYHFFIRSEGLVQVGRDLEKVPSAQAGKNTGTIAICLHGLVEDDFTLAQFDALRELCAGLNALYGNKLTFHGHCEVSAKACPVFDYKAVLGLDGKGNLAGQYQLPSVKVKPKEERGPREVIREGSTGEAVSELQSILKLHVDGQFGPQTASAVRKFQWDNELLADGIVGNDTWTALLRTQTKKGK